MRSNSPRPLLALIGLACAFLFGAMAAPPGPVQAGPQRVTRGTGLFGGVQAATLQAGSSGSAGSVYVYPATASKGKITLAAAASAGDTVTTLTNASMAAARTFTIPDPGASAKFDLSAVEVESANGAIGIKQGLAALTKAGGAAMTLAAPTAGTDDGKVLRIVATTANAHTVTQTTPGFNNAGTSGDVGTFGGAVGDSLTVIAYNGVWYTLSIRNVTLG